MSRKSTRVLLPLLALTLLATAGLPVVSTASAECAADCIENCQVTLRARQAGAGCDVGHQPREVWTACPSTGCGSPVLHCQALEPGRNPGCHASVLDAAVEPHCHQVFVGPDIDQGICYDLASHECRVWWYDTYGTGGGNRCYL